MSGEWIEGKIEEAAREAEQEEEDEGAGGGEGG